MLSHREDRVNGTGPDSTDVGYGWQRAGELEHAAGGGQGDADGVQAPSAGSAAGDRGGADHAVGLGLEGVSGVEAVERHVQVLQRQDDEEQAGGQRHVQGLRDVEAALGDLVAALDQERPWRRGGRSRCRARILPDRPVRGACRGSCRLVHGEAGGRAVT